MFYISIGRPIGVLQILAAYPNDTATDQLATAEPLWVYVGSHNFTAAAWGRPSGAGVVRPAAPRRGLGPYIARLTPNMGAKEAGFVRKSQALNNFELGIVARPADVGWQAPFRAVVPYTPDEEPWLM